jgi:hypothetical protein
LNDSIWPLLSETVNQYFYQNTHSQYYLYPYSEESKTLLSYKFLENMTYVEYTRSMQTVLDVLGEVGGIFTSLSGIGLAFTLAFSYNLMMASLMK